MTRLSVAAAAALFILPAVAAYPQQHAPAGAREAGHGSLRDVMQPQRRAAVRSRHRSTALFRIRRLDPGLH